MNEFDLTQRILEINSANLAVNLEILNINKENAKISRVQNDKIISLLSQILEVLESDSK